MMNNLIERLEKYAGGAPHEAAARIRVLEEALEPFALLIGVNMNDPISKWLTVAQLADASRALGDAS